MNESTFTLEVKVKKNQIQLKSKAKKLINSKDSIVYLYYISLDSSATKLWKRGEFSWISTGIMPSDPYNRLNDVSMVQVWGVV